MRESKKGANCLENGFRACGTSMGKSYSIRDIGQEYVCLNEIVNGRVVDLLYVKFDSSKRPLVPVSQDSGTKQLESTSSG